MESIRFDKAFCALMSDYGVARVCNNSGQAVFDKLVQLIDSRAARRQPDAGVVPDTWFASVQYAYGYLWHVNAGVGAPGDCAPPSLTAEAGAMKARKILYNLLDHHQRGDAISLVRSELPYTTTPPASPVPASVRAAVIEEIARHFERPEYKQEMVRTFISEIRALASKPVEVAPEQRCDSTNEQGRADAVDGARYRWLRDSSKSGACIRALYEDGTVVPDAVDEMIDRAIAAESAKGNAS
jgi:hypothetical protein